MDNKRLTFRDIIAKKTKIEEKKIKFKEIYSDTLEGNLLFKVPSTTELLEDMTGLSEDDIQGSYEVAKKTVYNNCTELHKQDLLDAFEVVDPLDIIERLFKFGEIMNIFKELQVELGLEDVEEKVKN